MRYFYTFLIYLALPFILLRLVLRSRREPAYRLRLLERLGFYPLHLDKCLWVHAVSVGEALAAVPLVKSLKERYPTLPIVMTTMTLTGSQQVKKVLGDTIIHVYIPYDLPDAVRRFLRAVNPVVAVIMETEMWPNMFAACHSKKIPVCLVNARLSEKSARGYRKIAPLTREMLQHINYIAAHGQEDAQRFIALGAHKDRVSVTGNIKFDIELPSDLLSKSMALRNAFGKDRFIWIAASTHEGEEEQILFAHKKLLGINPQALLILVPRHPERFAAITKMCAQTFSIARRSLQEPCLDTTTVYIGDTMGELLLLYGASDVVFVGGSLIERGGHNLLEPGALGKPILTGPHLYNFTEISELFFAESALTKVVNAEVLAYELNRLMQNVELRNDMSARALRVMAANRGALAKQMELVANVLQEAS